MLNSHIICIIAALSVFSSSGAGAQRKSNTKKTTAEFIESLHGVTAPAPERSAGSLYDTGGRLADLGRDLRASQLGDTITVVISDRASAVSKGTSKSSRQSGVEASVTALGGPTRVAGPLSALAGASGQQQLNGQGETSRTSELYTTLTARVVHVLPNGSMVVEGLKSISINSERQVVTLRGVVRWNDLNAGNRVSSDRLSDLEVSVEGKGLVGDAIRRPGFIYRLLLGILPF